MKKRQILFFCIHGLGGRAAWFDNLIQAALQLDQDDKEFSFHCIDLIGFGHSQSRGRVNDYQLWLDQCQSEYETLKKENPNTEIVVLGHSMGALITANLKIEQNDKIILSVPGFKGHDSTFNPLFVLKVMLTKLIAGNTLVDLPASSKTAGGYIDGELTTSDPTAWDKLRTFTVSANTLWQIKELTELCPKNITQINNPVLMLQAERDTVVDNSVHHKFLELMPSKNKELYIVKDSLHDWIWYDQVYEVAEKIVNWV